MDVLKIDSIIYKTAKRIVGRLLVINQILFQFPKEITGVKYSFAVFFVE